MFLFQVQTDIIVFGPKKKIVHSIVLLKLLNNFIRNISKCNLTKYPYLTSKKNKGDCFRKYPLLNKIFIRKFGKNKLTFAPLEQIILT